MQDDTTGYEGGFKDGYKAGCKGRKVMFRRTERETIGFGKVYTKPTQDGTKGDLRRGELDDGQTIYEVGDPDGVYVHIPMQHGTLIEKGVNGVLLEQLLFIVKDTLEDFQAGEFACEENANALSHTQKALDFLDVRARARIAQGVEGQHVKHES